MSPQTTNKGKYGVKIELISKSRDLEVFAGAGLFLAQGHDQVPSQTDRRSSITQGHIWMNDRPALPLLQSTFDCFGA
ncbi:hypothetical protein BofuT4_uP133610.1 [Botrytis cinerea T4]|uniref:Uncharacterized protein n=1 Tax=Botryotinia fuckeliana (strain T4) TaxID=999810 RepID=G2YQA9_BOTF4|nr:hypothetical protein BofuT4_uP133610.1 [Botrytis cinerea T4]